MVGLDRLESVGKKVGDDDGLALGKYGLEGELLGTTVGTETGENVLRKDGVAVGWVEGELLVGRQDALAVG